MKKFIAVILIITSLLGIICTIHTANKEELVPEIFELEKRENSFKEENPPLEKPDVVRDDKNKPEFNEQNIWRKNETRKLETKYIIIICTLSIIFALSIMYLIMTITNKTIFVNKDKITIYILGSMILTILISFISIFISNNYILNKNINEETKKDEITLDTSTTISPGNINLNDYKKDITIKEGGTYTLTGDFTNSIIIDAKNEDIELILNGVNIKNDKTAAIIGLNASLITINLQDQTENTLSDGGNSEYDGCIFSNAELLFTGNGKLIVNGNQQEGEGIATEAKNITINSGTYIITSNDDGINAGGDGATIIINGGNIYIDANGDGIDSNKDAIINGGTLFVMGSSAGGDAGIDTDDGYIINGGNIIALGSDMIEVPTEKSKQTTLAFTLDKEIEENKIITLMKENEEIISFTSPKKFKTIIISNEKLDYGKYNLYTDGTHTGTLNNGIYKEGTYIKGNIIKINNMDTFEITKKVNLYGSVR